MSGSRPVKVYVIEDEELLLESITGALQSGLSEWFGEEGCVVEGYKRLADYYCDHPVPDDGEVRIVVLDLFLDGNENGFAALRDPVFRGLADYIIGVSRMSEKPQLRYMLKKELLDAFIAKKSGTVSEIVKAVVTLGNGGDYRNEVMVEALESEEEDPVARLSEKQIEILVGLDHGKTVKQIAIDMGIGDKAVYRHRDRAYERIGTTRWSEIRRLLTIHGYIA
ncbi:LuxR C-terminal-related transcriptional regulator [Thioalkalivibrio sp. ALE23]|uniref:helix-turn-helix transcriptional regulator n=1 Tax=Thioalkalivibrio sp. ALE23 TaxID=1265495 RepID=UPI00037B2D2B|nr:LuxR C-terminal-related transcriptional regulator [Thioalkalivibrio sp. ALE23]